jgi:hypothetical protein
MADLDAVLPLAERPRASFPHSDGRDWAVLRPRRDRAKFLPDP